MTTSGAQSNSGNNFQSGTSQQQQTQVILQQSSQPQGATSSIRKVGSSGNLSSLQQKVQVFNKQNIQIVQPTSQRVAKAGTIQTNSNATTTATTITTGNTTTTTVTPLQFQQAFQQQTSKLGNNQQSSS